MPDNDPSYGFSPSLILGGEETTEGQVRPSGALKGGEFLEMSSMVFKQWLWRGVNSH